MTSAVLSVGFGERHEARLDRLVASLDAVGHPGRRLIWRGELPPWSPPHGEQRYAFKLAAFAEAAVRGARRALWLDAACVTLRPLDPLFDLVEEHGVLLFDNPPHDCGQWTSDAALPILGFRDRDEASTVPQCTAAVVGLDLGSELGARFLDLWDEHRRRGAFTGGKRNDGRLSADPRCRGHRWEQSSASAIAWRLGVPLLPWRPWFTDAGVEPPGPATVVALDRHGDLS